MKPLAVLLFLFVSVCMRGQNTPSYEGFFKRESDGTYFFFEIRNDSLLPLRKVIFKGVEAGKVESGIFRGRGDSDPVSIFVSGIKSDEKVFYNQRPYNLITITGVKKTNGRQFWNFYTENKARIITPHIDGVFEGYYHDYGREYVFQEKKFNYGKIDENHSLVIFNDDKQRASVWHLAGQSNDKTYHTDALIKVAGTLFYGNITEYGYNVASGSLLKVDKIIAVDRKKTYDGFLTDNLIKGYVVRNDTIFPPNDFAIGKTYRYTGIAKDTLGSYNIDIQFTKKSAVQLKYTLKVTRNNKENFLKYGSFKLTVPIYLPGEAWFNNRFYDTHYMYIDRSANARIYIAFSPGIKSYLSDASPPPVILLDALFFDFTTSSWPDLELKLTK